MDARPLTEQAAMILSCHAINTAEYAKCYVKHDRLLEWSNKVVTRGAPED